MRRLRRFAEDRARASRRDGAEFLRHRRRDRRVGEGLEPAQRDSYLRYWRRREGESRSQWRGRALRGEGRRGRSGRARRMASIAWRRYEALTQGSLRLPDGGDSHRMTALETIQ